MSKNPFWRFPPPKFPLRLFLILGGVCAAFPAASDAATCGGGTHTTMVLSYAYTPPRWIARCDPLNVKGFQLSVGYDATLMVDQIIGKVPFLVAPLAGLPPGTVTIMSTNNPPTSPGDVDIFELVIKPTSLNFTFTENFDGVIPAHVASGLDEYVLRCRHPSAYLAHISRHGSERYFSLRVGRRRPVRSAVADYWSSRRGLDFSLPESF